jgi:hypothetical protein
MGSPGLSTGFPFLCFYSIYRDGHRTISEKISFTVTFGPRWLWCLPRLIISARLGKVFCSSELYMSGQNRQDNMPQTSLAFVEKNRAS